MTSESNSLLDLEETERAPSEFTRPPTPSISPAPSLSDRFEAPTTLAQARELSIQILDGIKEEIRKEDPVEINWCDEHFRETESFLLDRKSAPVLLIYRDELSGDLRVTQASPMSGPLPKHMFFLLKLEDTETGRVPGELQRGRLQESHLISLLKQMQTVYAPIFFKAGYWPGNVKNELSSHLHRFLAGLTDSQQARGGQTVLYIPDEGPLMSSEDAPQSRELVQRLETAMIHWTRQIKDVLGAQDSIETGDGDGPLEEIQFWRDRCENLSGISSQVRDPKVTRISQILEQTNSSYLASFLKISRMIQEGSGTAESNVQFLSLLREPCETLSRAPPTEIPALLPGILTITRVIWLHSQHYNTPERLTGLLRKVSNEIITRCCEHISLEDLFNGNIKASQASLHESIHCCEHWHKLYLDTAKLHSTKNPTRQWILDESSIFTQVDAFIQRCKDLLDVCEGQIHFGRWWDGNKLPLPCIPGSRGTELMRSLQEIEATFEKYMRELREIKPFILDIKSTVWNERANSFRNGIKEMEVMMQNALSTAFETVKLVEEGVSLLDAFHHLSTRESIRRTLNQKTVEVYHHFMTEMNRVKAEYNARVPRLGPFLPHYAGMATWARKLKMRIDKPMRVLERAYYLHHVGQGEEAKHQYDRLANSLSVFVNKTFDDWASSIDKDVSKLLENYLMCRGGVEGQLLDLRFPKQLLKLLPEIHYWERLRFEIPHYTTEVYSKREELRALREHVLLVVRDYNKIVTVLTAEERKLFKERIRYLDKKVHTGLSKLTWMSKGVSESYITQCRQYAKEVKLSVKLYKGNSKRVGQLCKGLSEMLLIRHETPVKTLFEKDEFLKEQVAHRKNTGDRIRNKHEEIVSIIRETASVFSHDGPEVQTYLQRYTVTMDRLVEEALRLNVKWSLQELNKAVNGDGRTAAEPFCLVKVMLTSVESSPARVDYIPKLDQLTDYVTSCATELTLTLTGIHRLPDILHKKRTYQNTISDVITNDGDIKKLQDNIVWGVGTSVEEVNKFIQKTWVVKGFKEVWELNKDRFIERYQTSLKEKPVAIMGEDVGRYNEISNNAQQQDTKVPIHFVMLDCSPLKNNILRHCTEWQTRLCDLLLDDATTRLDALQEYMRTGKETLSADVVNLDELGDQLGVLKQLQEEKSSKEQLIMPIQNQFVMLDSYSVSVPEQVTDRVEQLRPSWDDFSAFLVTSEDKLMKHKEKFKAGLLQSAEDFKRQVTHLFDDFQQKGPFSSKVSSADALELIRQTKKQLEDLRTKENKLKKGLTLFNIKQPANNAISILEKELEQLELIWSLSNEWEEAWNTWKVGKFGDLDTDKMLYDAQGIYKRLTRIGREVKEKGWDICDILKERIDQFKRTMPLIQDLKNDALRPRHWHQLQDEIQKPFDQESEEFTLEKIIELGFDQHSEVIAEISTAASKELAIENLLKSIVETWQEVELDIAPYKTRGHHRIKASEEFFQLLDDNQVSLSTVKGSRFVKPFEAEVDKWERTLSLILEVIEMAQQVQRSWIYLENIFIGQDIRKQLPGETSEFDHVDVDWKAIMQILNEDKNALRATHQPHLLDRLTNNYTKLEKIQKSLDMYLETKRQLFPRFYFLSNEDLLEILGQSRNPEAVQPHLRKCFDNLKLLELRKEKTKTFAQQMVSGEGEKVDLHTEVLLEGPVEAWLTDIENQMRNSLHERLIECRIDLRRNPSKREKWVFNWPGQLTLTSSLIQWTSDCTKALQQVKERGEKRPLKSLKKKQITLLEKYSEMVRGRLDRMQRAKIVALITIEVHARDVIDRMAKGNCNDVNAFEWLLQLRFYWDREVDDCIIRQTNTHFQYNYEYLGCSGRLVITPLTDRCYVTLTTAMHLYRGGSPKGPAGTGKTETVKDLGKAMGNYVIVINCSDGLDYKSMGRMFSGLAQTGAWGCFDEFNRINIEVLSVVAQQILSILKALGLRKTRFTFEGREISLISTCGIFITMNPGYAGRTELPDNLKSMFRPIAMIVPDSALIAEIILFGEGFGQCRLLARKVNTLYVLAAQQLSKQDHYDFGLRALVSVVKYAGKKKRASPEVSDEEILLLAMKDMNLAKLTSHDLPLFNAITSDLFPGIYVPQLDYSLMINALTSEFKAANLQPREASITKVIQLYETKNTRHATMMVGYSGSGKSVAWTMLQSALTRLNKENPKLSQYQKVFIHAINPKAVALDELYGKFDHNTNEWTDGILASVMRTTCSDEKPDEKWILFDGPVDTLWIESMNSVMDDNKILTLINGERIGMPEQVSLLFELEDLAVASPATVSRSGMVYFDSDTLGFEPYFMSWLQMIPKKLQDPLKSLVNKHVNKVLEFRNKNCKELIPITSLNSIRSLCRLLKIFCTPENGVNPDDTENFSRLLEMWFLFSIIWSIGASVDEDGRKKMDNLFREMEGGISAKDTVYEYYIDVKNKAWTHWDQKLIDGWKYNPSLPFHKLIVPTVDTVRYHYLGNTLIQNLNPVMFVGPIGTGKTLVSTGILSKLDENVWKVLVINLSAQTTSNNIQEIIESKMEKRTKGVFVPLGGKKMVTFLDDFNMPKKDRYGSQPPLELMRQWMDYGFWFDRQKQIIKNIRDMYLMAAMGPPGGGRMVISRRLQSKFSLFNMTFPTESQIKRIFGSMINQKLQEFEEDIKPLGVPITQATIDVYNYVSVRFLPTPTKMHYLFNMRDMAKVYQGMMRANKNYHDRKESMIRLWIHECYRVFADRLVEEKDRIMFNELITGKLASMFDVSFHSICKDKVTPLFGDLLNQQYMFYEDLNNFKHLKTSVENALQDYNNEPGMIPMDLVLFRNAVEHVTRITRVIRLERGNMLLIGIGGSGRQSLTRLAAYIIGYSVFQIDVTRHYRLNEFREDIRKLYYKAGVEYKPTVFLFTDTQVVEESFLEDINNILSSGEVPNLYTPEDFEPVMTELAPIAKKEGIPDNTESMFSFFIERARNNLHVVLAMSPVGEPFRNRIRMYPAFVNCTTIDLFTEWPKDALLEVAEKYLEEVSLGDNAVSLSKAVASMFVTMHLSVVENSKRMLTEMKRHNYVTATNYLELVTGYKGLVEEKRRDLGNSKSKLENGIDKLNDTKQKVEEMSKELSAQKILVESYQKDCEEYLVVLVQNKHDADEQQKSVASRSAKIGEEEEKCKQMAEVAQKDLDEALPALLEAEKALEALNKNDIDEIRAYPNPPNHVRIVMEAVMTLRACGTSWAEAKKELGGGGFIKSLVNFDKDNIPDKILKLIGSKYINDPEFTPENVGRVSFAAKSLCMWVRAMEKYGKIYRTVEPKRKRLHEAMSKLEEKQKSLAEAQAKLREINERIEELKIQYEEKLAQKEELRRKMEVTQEKLERAGKLVSGLSGECERWTLSVAKYEESIGFLVGDCLLASAFLSYMGPFLSNYREDMISKLWIKQVRDLDIPCTPDFSFATFLSDPATIRDWNIQGLPADSFSAENGIIVTRGNRWPLMIDPQGQAIKWIKMMEMDASLKIIDLQQPDFLRTVENAVQFGTPVLLQNVEEELDPSLAPVLNKSIIKIGNRMVIKLGDKEVDYNPDFKLYITTKLSNPHYTPEISTKTTIVNFAVKEQGLEEQLLSTVVQKEQPDLQNQKNELVVSISTGKKQIKELEDKILYLLNTAQGSLLDDEVLVNALQSSKGVSQQVTEKVKISVETEKRIDGARDAYRPSAKRASILFFVMTDLGRIDPMYQFSLEAYIELFVLSIDKSQKGFKPEERIQYLNEYHTYSVYRYTCRGLFERHKLLFSFQMCAKILEASGKLNMDEYNFLLRGGVLLDRETQMDNPVTSWLEDSSWDHITELDKLPNFNGIANSFEQYGRDWNRWFTNQEPENSPLPGEWENACNELQRMLIVRCLRQDRVTQCVTAFITNNLGVRFVEPPVLNMHSVVSDSTARTPLIFVLSPGVDPVGALTQLALDLGKTDRFDTLSLGQGQAPIARKLITNGVKEGRWVFLANCHLSLSWMPHFNKLVEEELQIKAPHKDFRLWLSSSPHPEFPIAILQAGIKMTTEPPKGIKANMKRLYQTINEAYFGEVGCAHKFKKLLFALCFFHSVLIERRKFLMLGWNVVYGFNDSDFEVSMNILDIYLQSYPETPWDALKYLIAGVSYGGHVTDDWDRRLLLTYINDFFCDMCLEDPYYKLSSLPTYYIPKDGSLQSYRDLVDRLPTADKPEAFGQHNNADIASQIRETRTLLDTLLSLQPQVSVSQGQSSEDKVLDLAADVLKQIPASIDLNAAATLLADDSSALKVVLLQEIDRYNTLLRSIRSSLVDLEKGIKGLVVMSSDLDQVFICILEARVPPLWGKAYPSLKPLASWTRDLIQRVRQFSAWAENAQPPVLFWMSAFTFPTGFLTAVLQTAARQNNLSVDQLSWEFHVSTVDDANITTQPKDGVWIKGLFLEGAGWDKKSSCLVEPNPMQLSCSMPSIHFKPVESKKKVKGIYQAPCYYYPDRSGKGGVSFVVAVDLKSGSSPIDLWVKRGTALLMSLES